MTLEVEDAILLGMIPHGVRPQGVGPLPPGVSDALGLRRAHTAVSSDAPPGLTVLFHPTGDPLV